MNREILFQSICGIDDEILVRSERDAAHRHRIWKSMLAAAACFCVIAAAAVLIPARFPGKGPTPPAASVSPTPTAPEHSDPVENTREPQRTWTVYYNDVTAMLDAARLPIPGYFTQELNELELAAVIPDRRAAWMDYSGVAGFDGEGNLVAVHLTVATVLPDTDIHVTISEASLFRDYILPDEPVTSRCGDVEYTVYQYNTGGAGVLLEADAEINGCSFSFEMTAADDPANLGQAKGAFQQVLECFSYYPEGAPELSAVTAESIPEWFDQTLTQAEALDDPAFGAYLLKDVPSGFTEESIRRYKDQRSDYLSGLWTKGYDSLRWKVSCFSADDAARLTRVEDPQNYDLSLYPIPRAESVPGELRAMVDSPIFYADELTLDAVYARAYKVRDAGDTDGWRMNFNVKYGDILVSVSAKGIEPEWVYEQLVSLRGE